MQTGGIVLVVDAPGRRRLVPLNIGGCQIFASGANGVQRIGLNFVLHEVRNSDSGSNRLLSG